MSQIYIVTLPPLLDMLEKELLDLGITKIQRGASGLFIPKEMESVYKINYSSRLATRVLWPIADFRCRDREDLYNNVFDLEWPKLFPVEKSFAIDANVHSETLRHSLFAAQVMKDAICDRFRKQKGERPNVKPQDPDIQLNLFIAGDKAKIYFDTSGSPLHKRGWRKQIGPAPLHEGVAALLFLLTEPKDDEVICDPFCGTGTLLIEAALIKTNTPPGFFRKSWGFFNHPVFSQSDWEKVKKQRDEKIVPLEEGIFFGADKDPKMISMCMENLIEAGLDKAIQISGKDIRSFFPKKEPSLVLSNPPYGKRMQSSAEIFTALGHFLKTRCQKNVRASILCPDEELIKSSEMNIQEKIPLSFGGLELYLFQLSP